MVMVKAAYHDRRHRSDVPGHLGSHADDAVVVGDLVVAPDDDEGWEGDGDEDEDEGLGWGTPPYVPSLMPQDTLTIALT
jgi:hypothetical protein